MSETHFYPSEAPAMMQQSAPYPTILAKLVEALVFRGWNFRLGDMTRDTYQGEVTGGLTLFITAKVRNTYHPENEIQIGHLFPVPPATYNEQSWRRWLFDCCRKVDLHEAMEEFIVDGERPYAPNHGPGNDPYMIREVTTERDRATSFTGGVKTDAIR